MVTFYYRAAYASPRQLYNIQQFAIHTKTFKAVPGTVGYQQYGFSIAPVNQYTVCVIKVFIPFALAAKKVLQFSILVIMHYVLCTITIGNKNIPIGINSCFGWNKFFCFFICAGFQRYINSEQYPPIHSGFINLV